MTDSECTDHYGHRTGDRITSYDLYEGEHVDGSVAPVIWWRQLLLEMYRAANTEHPAVAADEPDQQEAAQDELGEPRRPWHEDAAATTDAAANCTSGLQTPIVVVIVINDVIHRSRTSWAHLTPE